jgi:hypothetical protein
MASEEDWVDPPDVEKLRTDMQTAIAMDMKSLPGIEHVDMVNHPPHYKHPSGVECIEVVRHCSNDMGAVIRYIWRYEDKWNPTEDLKKARWYLNDILTTGQATHLPHKAQVKLTIVNDFEPVGGLRFKLYSCLLHGDLNGATELITQEVGEG